MIDSVSHHTVPSKVHLCRPCRSVVCS